jgi:hypothetical protein
VNPFAEVADPAALSLPFEAIHMGASARSLFKALCARFEAAGKAVAPAKGPTADGWPAPIEIDVPCEVEFEAVAVVGAALSRGVREEDAPDLARVAARLGDWLGPDRGWSAESNARNVLRNEVVRMAEAVARFEARPDWMRPDPEILSSLAPR